MTVQLSCEGQHLTGQEASVWQQTCAGNGQLYCQRGSASPLWQPSGRTRGAQQRMHWHGHASHGTHTVHRVPKRHSLQALHGVLMPTTLCKCTGASGCAHKLLHLVVPGSILCIALAWLQGPSASSDACRYNMTHVPARSSLTTVKDEHSKPVTAHGYFPGDHEMIPPLVDIPPHIMSHRLYGAKAPE